MYIQVNCTHDLGPLAHFWRSTGFSPGELLLTADMRQQMAYIGAIPHGGLTFVRPHFLLELVQLTDDEAGRLNCDWRRLDAALDVIVRNRGKLIFELMGNPSGYFDDFRDDRQLRAWRDLTAELARHLIARYGLAEVTSWYFETWNEPDGGGWWPQGPDDISSFCNYYDACSEGLRQVHPALRLGGPGTCRTLSPLFRGFLAHCDAGVNYFTGEQGVRLDFISVHEKGARASKEDLTPNTGAMLGREIAAIEYIRRNHPRLARVPFMNNEGDPQVGWGDFHTWHGRPYYAAIICKLINQRLLGLMDALDCPYELLSSDNGFIGRWGNRSLLARFGPPQAFDDGQSHHKPALLPDQAPPDLPFEMIKKPALNVMALLALLGDRRCAVGGVGGPDADIGVIATRRGDGQVALLVYHSRDKIPATGAEPITLRLTGLPFAAGRLAHYRIAEGYGDPYELWDAAGGPPEPTAELFAEMRRRQEPALLEEPTDFAAPDGELMLRFDLPLPGVSLLLLSARPADPPAAVSAVRLESYRGLHGEAQTLVLWDGLPERTIRTYEVLRGDAPDGPFTRINAPDLIGTAFLDVRPPNAPPAFYRVAAVDYWGRTGGASPVASAAQ